MSAPAATVPAAQTPAAPQQDALDKGISMLTKKLGHTTDAQTTEKISDGVRSLLKKFTGKDVPIKDKS